MQKKMAVMQKHLSPSDREKETRGFTAITCRNKQVAIDVRNVVGRAAYIHPQNPSIVIVRGQGHARRADVAYQAFPSCKISLWRLARRNWTTDTIRRQCPPLSMPDEKVQDPYEGYSEA